MSLVNLNLNLNTDRTVNKIAFCSAVVAGFAYVGYSVCRTAFSRRRGRRNDDDSPHRSVFLRRLSQTTQTDTLFGDLVQDGPHKLIIRPKSVQERIRELNMQARQFANAVTAIQNNSHTRVNGVSGRSLQVTPWSSPRLLSPVDVRHIVSEVHDDSRKKFSPITSPSHRWARHNSFKINRRVDFDVQGEAKMKELLEIWNENKLEIIKKLQNHPTSLSEITLFDAECLVATLLSEDESLIAVSLSTIMNCAAFTANQNTFRSSGLLTVLPKLIFHYNNQIRHKACLVAGNMALNEQNNAEMCTVAVALSHIVQATPLYSDSSCLTSALSALVNIAVFPTWHKEMISILHKTYSLLDEGHWNGEDCFSLHSLRLLINLSCNEEMIPSLLAAQAPTRLIYLLDMSMTEDIVLRVLTLLANIATVTKQMNIDPLDLPAKDKAAAPDTMYAAVFGLSMVERYKKKALILSERHANEDIVLQARRLWTALSE